MGLDTDPDTPPPIPCDNILDLVQEVAASLVQHKLSDSTDQRQSAHTITFILFTTMSPAKSGSDRVRWLSDQSVADLLSALTWGFRVITFRCTLDRAALNQVSPYDILHVDLQYVSTDHDTVFEHFRAIAARIATVKRKEFAIPYCHIEGSDFKIRGNTAPFARIQAYVLAVRQNFLDHLRLVLELLNCAHLLQPDPNYSKIHDDLPNANFGYSFINDSRNDSILPNKDVLWEAMVSNPTYAEATPTMVRYKRSAILGLLYQLRLVKLAMIGFCHVGCGGTPRGTEESAIQITNSAGRLRNVLWIYKRVVFLASYTKTSHKGSDSVVPRAVDVEASQWVVIVMRCVTRILYMIESVVLKVRFPPHKCIDIH